MKRAIIGVLALLTVATFVGFQLKTRSAPPQVQFFTADNPNIQYMGRIDNSNPKKPRFWNPGVTVKASFMGSFCDVVLNDEQLWGNSYNYLEVVVDDKPPFRIRTKGKTNTLRVAEGLADGIHSLSISKNTEGGMGYLEFVGLRATGLVSPAPLPQRKLEFYGDSITCGASSDISTAACGKGTWYDQHNAFMSYGPTTARNLDAQWHLTSVSGIGMMKSCCDMKQTMQDVWDKTNLRENTLPWDFKRYQPSAVMVCLGQNDGAQNAEKFRETYITFLRKLRGVYPESEIVCLSSPMADANLRTWMKQNLTQIVADLNKSGDQRVRAFFFSRGFNSGCGGHPNIAEHQQIAGELTGFLKTSFGW